MDFMSELKLGFSTNVIDGLKSTWNPRENIVNILNTVEKKPLEEKSVKETTDRGKWLYPEVRFHDTVVELLSEIIPYKIYYPNNESDSSKIGAGALIAGTTHNEESLQNLSKSIGVNLADNELRYVSVKLVREDGVDSHVTTKGHFFRAPDMRNPHPKYGIDPVFQAKVKSLPRAVTKNNQPDNNYLVNKDEATEILNTFNTYGTHYVSAAVLGDSILQVFAYNIQQYDKLRNEIYKDVDVLTGDDALLFNLYTSDINKGQYGWVKEYGKIICLSNSDVFKTTIENNDWYEKDFAKENSIFCLYQVGSKLTIRDLQNKFTNQTIIEVRLTALNNLYGIKRSILCNHVFNGAIIQKYRRNIEPKLKQSDTRNFEKMLKDDYNDLLSIIPTPTVNLYKARLNLNDMKYFPDNIIQDLISFSLVLWSDSSDCLKLYGKKIRLFSQIFDMRTDSYAKSIVLDDEAFTTLELSCYEFLGAMAIENASGTSYNVIVDGIKYGLVGNGPSAKVIIEDDVRVKSIAEASLQLLKDSFYFSLTFAEAVLSDRSSEMETIKLAEDFLFWLSSIIPIGKGDQELLEIRVRAMTLAKYTTDPNQGVFVPILPYERYEELVQNILSYTDAIQAKIDENNRKLADRLRDEKLMDIANTLNENIKASGDLLLGIIESNLAQQKDLEEYYDSIIQQKKSDLEKQRNIVNELNAILIESQNEISTCIDEYKKAVTQWETIMAISLGISIAIDLFKLFKDFEFPSSSISQAKDFYYNAKKIQDLFNALNGLSNMYDNPNLDGLEDAQKYLDQLANGQFGSSSTLPWDELSLEFKRILDKTPTLAAEAQKSALDAAFGKLVLRGKTFFIELAFLSNLQREIYNFEMQKELAKKQGDRLSQLTDTLNVEDIDQLDISKIDLIGLTGQLTSIQKQMLIIMSKAFLQQDLALQYKYLQPATPVLAMNFLEFRNAIVQQNIKKIYAEEKLSQFQAGTTETIHYDIEKVSSKQLIDGKFYNAAICLNVPEFYKYADVKVLSVVASIKGIKSTNSNIYDLQVRFNGKLFNDRDLDKKTLKFTTPSRTRIYEYNVIDNSPRFTDNGMSWSEGVSLVTPFSIWEISLPKTQSNKGIMFDSEYIDIRLSFILKARIIVDSGKLPPQRNSKFPSKEEILCKMVKESCTNKWDVVFNMILDDINTALKEQYESLKNDDEYSNVIDTEWNTGESPFGNIQSTKFHCEYGYPLMDFNKNNSAIVTLTMDILNGSTQRCETNTDGETACFEPEIITGSKLIADIMLSTVEGKVTVGDEEHKVLSVCLNMQQGAFKVENMFLDPESASYFNQSLKTYFQNNPIEFLINRLDLTNIPTLDAMKPSGFLFKNLVTHEGNKILQLFIMTDGRPLQDISQTFLDNLEEPIPLGSTTSLIISSKLFYNYILPGSMSSKNWTLDSIEKENGFWSSVVKTGDISVYIDLSSLDSYASSQGMTQRITHKIIGGSNVSFSCQGDQFASQTNGNVLYSGSTKHTIVVRREVTLNIRKTTYTDYPIDIRIDKSCILSFKVKGTDRNQEIAIETSDSVGDVEPNIDDSCDSPQIPVIIASTIDDQMTPHLKESLKIEFKSISLFALQNLLFPEKNYIGFNDCFVPGDLIIFGNIKK